MKRRAPRADHRQVAPEVPIASGCSTEELRAQAAARAPWLVALAERAGDNPLAILNEVAFRREADDTELAEKEARRAQADPATARVRAVADELARVWTDRDATAAARAKRRVP